MAQAQDMSEFMGCHLGQITEVFIEAAALPSVGKDKISFQDSEKILTID
jgi:hypothetical protein